MGGPAPSSKFSFAKTDLLHLPGVVANCRAKFLEDMNKAVEISKLPPEEHRADCAGLMAPDQNASLLVPVVTARGFVRYMETGWEKQAQLRCAAAALAVERYRLKYGKWPEGLSDLKDEFVREVPTDPFDGQPLRYRKDDQGVLVYSVWPDDKAGITFRLWDVDKRRQPPPIPQPPGVAP